MIAASAPWWTAVAWAVVCNIQAEAWAWGPKFLPVEGWKSEGRTWYGASHALYLFALSAFLVWRFPGRPADPVEACKHEGGWWSHAFRAWSFFGRRRAGLIGLVLMVSAPILFYKFLDWYGAALVIQLLTGLVCFVIWTEVHRRGRSLDSACWAAFTAWELIGTSAGPICGFAIGDAYKDSYDAVCTIALNVNAPYWGAVAMALFMVGLPWLIQRGKTQ